MNELVELLIEDNLESKNPILDLGNCDLDGGEKALELLQECQHLHTLILANTWWSEEKQAWVNSQHKEEKNLLLEIPKYLPQQLNTLILPDGYLKNPPTNIFENTPQLETLSIVDNQLQNLSFLNSLKQLKKLNLYINQIQDITPLKELKQLQFLDLGENGIQDLRSLAELIELEYLNLFANKVQDISSLKHLKKLKKLYLNSNQIKDFSAIKELKYLQEIDIRFNPATDKL